MSNRTLIEINHDFTHVIERHPEEFDCDIIRYLCNADQSNAERLLKYGIRVFGMRHHSDAFEINWGGIKASEGTQKR